MTMAKKSKKMDSGWPLPKFLASPTSAPLIPDTLPDDFLSHACHS